MAKNIFYLGNPKLSDGILSSTDCIPTGDMNRAESAAEGRPVALTLLLNEVKVEINSPWRGPDKIFLFGSLEILWMLCTESRAKLLSHALDLNLIFPNELFIRRTQEAFRWSFAKRIFERRACSSKHNFNSRTLRIAQIKSMKIRSLVVNIHLNWHKNFYCKACLKFIQIVRLFGAFFTCIKFLANEKI